MYDDFLLFHESEGGFGLGGLLVFQEYDVQPCGLGSFNSTADRNGESCRVLKLRKRVFFVLSLTSVSYNMVAVEQLKVAGGTEELNKAWSRLMQGLPEVHSIQTRSKDKDAVL